MINKKGFTLAEAVIALVVMGLIIILTLTTVKLLPNKNKALFKKAFQVISNVSYEILNDEDLYPDAVNLGYGDTSNVAYFGEDFGGDSKFCNLFARMINTSNNTISCESTVTPSDNIASDLKVDEDGEIDEENGETNSPSVVSADGIEFYLPVSGFATTQSIYMDVNNTAGPNCLYNEASCPKPDRFLIKVTKDGRVYAENDSIEMKYLENHTLQSDNE